MQLFCAAILRGQHREKQLGKLASNGLHAAAADQQGGPAAQVHQSVNLTPRRSKLTRQPRQLAR
jgi:hypothetical protein